MGGEGHGPSPLKDVIHILIDPVYELGPPRGTMNQGSISYEPVLSPGVHVLGGKNTLPRMETNLSVDGVIKIKKRVFFLLMFKPLKRNVLQLLYTKM